MESWEDLCRELKSQFFPKNASSIARDKILDLKHMGSVREYVKKFAGYMLDIQDMAESDKVHQFIRNLKPWAKTELNRLDPPDLAAAMTAAEWLIDYTSGSTTTKTTPNLSSSNHGGGKKQGKPW